MWRLVGWIIPGFGRVSKIQLKITVSTMSSSFKMLWVWLFLLKFQWQRKNQIETAAAMSLQSCPTLCDPIDGSPPGSPVPGILQAKTLEWVAISFSNAWKWKVKVKSLSRVWLLATPWTAAYQAPLSMGFSRQEYWSGVPLPSLGAWVYAKSVRLCLTLCNPMDCSLSDTSLHGILQARILEWVAMPSSRGSSWPRDRTCVSCISCIAGRFFTPEPPGKPQRIPQPEPKLWQDWPLWL